MKVYSLPIKSQMEVDAILNYLRSHSLKFYVFTVLVLNTGAGAADIIGTLKENALETNQFTNGKNGVTFIFDDDFKDVLGRYCAECCQNSIYLFPSSDGISKARSSAFLSYFKNAVSSAGYSYSFSSFQKTFALDYLKRYGTLSGSGLGKKYGYTKQGVCEYLFLTEDEYDTFSSANPDHILLQGKMTLLSAAFSEIMDSFNDYIAKDDYIADMDDAYYTFAKHMEEAIHIFSKITSKK